MDAGSGPISAYDYVVIKRDLADRIAGALLPRPDGGKGIQVSCTVIGIPAAAAEAWSGKIAGPVQAGEWQRDP